VRAAKNMDKNFLMSSFSVLNMPKIGTFSVTGWMSVGDNWDTPSKACNKKNGRLAKLDA
jgi:hypothetical protein